MSDIYAEFGVNNAVMSSSNPVEHEQNMLALDVSARDGDDSIVLNMDEGKQEDLGQEDLGNSDDQSDSEEEQEEDLNEESEGDEQGQDDAPQGDDDGDFVPLGDPSEELTEASMQIEKHAEGFFEMRSHAIKLGLPAAVADTIEAEYEADGKLSTASYAALAKVGYTQAFVDSYLQGQEALAETYVSRIVAYAGGQQSFDAIMSHLNATNPDALQSLTDAIERQDLATVKTVINLGMASRTKKLGKPPVRSVTRKAPAVPTRKAPQGPQGYESRADMVRDMGSSKYREDPKFRAQVEARVAASGW